MPIFFQQDLDGDTRLAIWKIEEAEDFFLRQVPLQQSITHPHKRLQHLAGRYLLQYLFPSFPVSLIRIADTRKPFLENEAFHFSISHCGDHAAVIVSRSSRVGVDIERISEKTERIRHKFMTPPEAVLLAPVSAPFSSSTLLWCLKESVFKWYGAGGIDFRAHIGLQRIEQAGPAGFIAQIAFRKNEEVLLRLHSRFFGDLCLSYVATRVQA